MDPEILRALESRRSEIRAHWEALLRLERASSALAQPDTLVHLLDITLDEIFHLLSWWLPPENSRPVAAPHCPCGRNPLLAYFDAGHQALRDALVKAQTTGPVPTPQQRDTALARVECVFAEISRREIGAFCALCQFRDAANNPGLSAGPAGLGAGLPDAVHESLRPTDRP